MTHSVEAVVVGDDALGYSIRCAYPDGTRVLCVATATLRDGRIAESGRGAGLGRRLTAGRDALAPRA